MNNLSRHVMNDDMRHYRFERNTRLPRDTFDPPKLSVDAWVFIACFIGVALLLILTRAL